MRMALTMTVINPMGPTASMILSGHPIDTERNCFVGCSPKRSSSGPMDVPTVLMKSVQSLAAALGVRGNGPEVVVFGGAILG